MDPATLFGPIATDALAAIGDLVPIAAPVFGGFVLIGIALAVLRKFGVRR